MFVFFLTAHRVVRKTGDGQRRKARGNTSLDVCTAGGVATHALSCSMCAALTARYASEQAATHLSRRRVCRRSDPRHASLKSGLSAAVRRRDRITGGSRKRPLVSRNRGAADIPFSRATADAASCVSSRGLKFCGVEGSCVCLVRTFQGAR